jgi:hypothetical protein
MYRATFVTITLAAAVLAQAPQETPQSEEGRPAGPGIGQRQAAPQIRPYEKVITSAARSTPGVFTVHRIDERVLYEIPKSELGKDFLWVSKVAKTTLGAGYGGSQVGNHVVRWERRDRRVLLRKVNFEIVADPKSPVAQAVEAANTAGILMAFNIEALGKDEAPVIDVSRLFTTEITEFSARNLLRARGFDATRSYVDRVVSFPTNIEVNATHTFTSPPDAPGAGGVGGPRPPTPTSPFAGTPMRPGSATVVMHFSMVKLPENPMAPRLADERVGYFSVRHTDYGRDEHRAPQRRFITRWRLEKKDPNAEMSEPVKPIVFYVDPATPAKWIPYVKKGIEAWQPAFEAAGFRNAIIAKEAPKDDPTWSPEDARYSVVRWLPSTIENASGPHVHDPRTGEILEADINYYHNIMNLLTSWYFIQVAPLDPRAQKLPLPDDLMGDLHTYVVAHEVGHTLGFQHNMKASSMYPAEKVRDREWVKKMGHVATLMDYSRYNYVAQPEDNIDPKDLIPGIGPYDKWATRWGYKPIPSAKSPDEEKAVLDEWAREQDTTPWYRFSTARSRGADPGELTEAVGDADAVKSTGLGLKNLERVAGMLLSATVKRGENYDDLEMMYGRLLGQWSRELNHVAAIVGGVESQQKHGGQNGVLFKTIPKARQVEAVGFLNQNAFRTPKFLVSADIARRIEPDGLMSRLRTAQLAVLNSLLSGARINRMIEQEALEGAAVYRSTEFLADVRRGIWGEVGEARVSIDAFRRNLQRGYLEALNDRINGRLRANDETRALYRGELKALDGAIAGSLARAADRSTRLHLEDARDQIARILDPRFAAQEAPAGAARFGLPSLDEDDVCWPDLIIR